MDNKTILLNALLTVQPDCYKILTKYSINPSEFIEILLKFKNYNLAKELSLYAGKLASLIKELFPHRVPNNSKLHTYILGECELKYCNKCNNIMSIDNFYKNKSKLDGVSNCCKSCQKSMFKTWYENDNGVISKQHSTYRRTLLKLVCPKWADQQKIRDFYRNCPKGMTVDHIIPLNSDIVCGLHVDNNFQYLSKSNNSKKGNTWQV